MGKRILFVLFCIVLLVSLILVGCSSSTTSKAPSSSAAPAAPAAPAASSAAPSGKVYELTVAYGDTKTKFSDAELIPWMSQIEQDSKGQIKFSNVYYAGQLIADAEIFDAASRGTVDIAVNTTAQTPNRWVIMDLLSITPIGSTCKDESQAYRDVFKKYQSVFDQQFSEVKILNLHGTIPDPPGLPLGTVKKELTSLEDLKGLKLCGPGKYNMDLMTALGASPTMVPPPEQYTALQKGILDATILDPIFYDMLNFKDLIKYQTSNFSLGGSPWFMVMNKDKFNSLPKDLQDIIVKDSSILGDKRDSFGLATKTEIVQNAVKNNGLKLVEISATEIAKMKDIEKTILSKQIADYASKLPNAQEIFDYWVSARANHN
jgi:TRAP-type transport system periplasmic protein